MAANLRATGGQIVSERISALLAPRLGSTAAKELLTRASSEAADTGRPLVEVLAGRDEVRGALSPVELAPLLDPAHYTGMAGPLVDRALTASGPPPATGPGKTSGTTGEPRARQRS
ncbi:hypothetical protein [Streptomyces sp. YPW6]